MNLRDLQYLIAVADARHFGRAAEASHVSQPTLSMQLKKLEETLGVQLFERNNRQVMITPVGEEIARRARIILRDVEGLREIAKAAQDPLSGELRLGVFPTLAPYYLPTVIPALRKQLPELKLLLVEEKTETLIEQLKSGALDAALLALPVEDEGLETMPLFNDPFLLAVPKGHTLGEHTKIQQKDIMHQRLLLLEEGHCLRAQALEVCQINHVGEHEDFRATSLETLRQMVASGVGITLMPQMAMKPDDMITYIPFAAPAPMRTIGLIWRKQTARRQCLKAVGDVLLKSQK